MNKKLLLVALALFATACVPITPEPAAANCSDGYLNMRPGQRAGDPISTNLPDYLDIVRVESSLDEETLTAIFYLRGIPEDMAFNRKGVENMQLEYMWTVDIDIEGDATDTSDQTNYTFATFYPASRVSADAPATTRPYKNAVQIEVWEKRHDSEKNEIQWISAPVHPRLLVSHEDNTLTLIGRIPGITDESVLLFSSFDILLGQDGVSCPPN